MAELDVVVVGYRSGEDWEALARDLPVMCALPFELHYFDNSENGKTLTVAWNDLARQGDAPYIAFLNTDIRISPEWDLRLSDALAKIPALGCALGNPVGHGWPTMLEPPGESFPDPAYAPAPPPEAMTTIAAKLKDNESFEHFPHRNAAFFAVMVRRRDWEALQGFDERFRFYGQDHDFQRRIGARLDMRVSRVNRAPIWHRCGGSIKKAAGSVNFGNELRHMGVLLKGIKEKRHVDWDRLSSEERKMVRKDLIYSRMPTHRR